MQAIDVRHPALPDLFDPDLPNAPMLFGVLEGRLPGRALADDPTEPRIAAVQDRQGIAWVSRTTAPSEFDLALEALRRDAMVGLIWAATNGSVSPPEPAKAIERLGFGPMPTSDRSLEGLRATLPHGIDVRPMDADLVARCEWRELLEAAHGSIGAFLDHGQGLCLMRGDEILAEAYAPFIGRGVAEVGVVTAEAHRGQGLAAIAVACLAESLDAAGLAMYWSCDTTNEASVRVAQKLGFGAAGPFRILMYRPLAA